MRASILRSRRRFAKVYGLLFAGLVVAGFLLGASFSSPAQATSYSADEVAFVQMLNDYRVGNGLQALLVSDMISEACYRHNSDMGKYRFFDHYTTGGSDWFAIGASPWDRMAASGYNFNTYKGENIAAGYGSAAAVFQGWKSSAGHNANMLDPNFKVLGVSLVYVSGSPYGSYWTTDFGGYVDSTAHSVGSAPATTTTTLAPTTTTLAPTTTTTQPRPTTTAAPTTTSVRLTTTTARPTTTTVASPPPATTTTVHVPPTTTTTTLAPTTTTLRPTTTTTVAAPVPTAGFSDVDGSTPYAAEIKLLAERGIITGYGDGTFGPDRGVTRQQFAKMIILTLGYHVSPMAASVFRDVQVEPDSPDPLYPAGYIAACAAAGITTGKTPVTFGPWDSVTRAQLITMVARGAQLPNPPWGYRPPFADFSPEHYPWAVRAAAAGLLDGLVDMGPNFDFWAPATRAEVCLLLANLLDE